MWLLSTSTATFVITADVQVCYYIHAVTDDRVSAPQTPSCTYGGLLLTGGGSVAEWLEGPRFKSQPRRCRVTVLGKLFTPIVPMFTKQRNW